MKISYFHSKRYEVVVGNLQARGTWYILRRCDNARTLRNVCYEGRYFYIQLLRTWRKSRAMFDALCDLQEYHVD